MFSASSVSPYFKKKKKRFSKSLSHNSYFLYIESKTRKQAQQLHGSLFIASQSNTLEYGSYLKVCGFSPENEINANFIPYLLRPF